MTKINKFMQNFGEIPGSIILVVLVFWQVSIGVTTSDQALFDRCQHLQEQLFQVCWRSQANLRVIETLMKDDTKEYGKDITANSVGPLFKMPECVRYVEGTISRSGFSINVLLAIANEISEIVQFWIAVVGIFLFLIGIIWRLSTERPSARRPIITVRGGLDAEES